MVVPAVVATHRTPLVDPLVAGGMDTSGKKHFQTLRSGSKYFSSLMTFRPRESNTFYTMLQGNPLAALPFSKILYESL